MTLSSQSVRNGTLCNRIRRWVCLCLTPRFSLWSTNNQRLSKNMESSNDNEPNNDDTMTGVYTAWSTFNDWNTYLSCKCPSTGNFITINRFISRWHARIGKVQSGRSGTWPGAKSHHATGWNRLFAINTGGCAATGQLIGGNGQRAATGIWSRRQVWKSAGDAGQNKQHFVESGQSDATATAATTRPYVQQRQL